MPKESGMIGVTVRLMLGTPARVWICLRSVRPMREILLRPWPRRFSWDWKKWWWTQKMRMRTGKWQLQVPAMLARAGTYTVWPIKYCPETKTLGWMSESRQGKPQKVTKDCRKSARVQGSIWLATQTRTRIVLMTTNGSLTMNPRRGPALIKKLSRGTGSLENQRKSKRGCLVRIWKNWSIDLSWELRKGNMKAHL